MASSIDTAHLASELRMVLGHLMRRLRAENKFSLSQGAVLGRLDRHGTMSIGDLAVAERVRPQSMAQTIGEMEADGLIDRRPDPADGRRMLVELTAHGRGVLEEDRRNREGWLARALADELSHEEQQGLRESLAVLRRLSES